MIKKESDIIKESPQTEIAILGIQSYIEAADNNAALYEEKNFEKRIEVIDFIEFEVLDHIEVLLPNADYQDKFVLLKHRAEKLKFVFEEINFNLFKRLQKDIQLGRCTGKRFKNLINEYIDLNSGEIDHEGYDNLDLFINGLFPFQTMPEQTKDLEPEMVFYQKTPARIVFELVEKSHFKKEDVFFDLGSGLGQVAILVNLLAGITTRGIEFEPAFCRYAEDCAADLNLSNVTFINVDARDADYTEGTVFFMYTPFKGEILKEVLAILRTESLQRKIKIITYGPCTLQVVLQSWLVAETLATDNVYQWCAFTSF